MYFIPIFLIIPKLFPNMLIPDSQNAIVPTEGKPSEVKI